MSKDTLSLFTPHISHTRELYVHNFCSFDREIGQEISIQKGNASNLRRGTTSHSSLSMLGTCSSRVHFQSYESYASPRSPSLGHIALVAN